MKRTVDPRHVARHPIAVVAERTGLSQDVLRVWERRYHVVAPKRDDGGRRLYSDADVDRLTALSAAARAGRSVGTLAPLSTDAIALLVEDDARARDRRVSAEVTSNDESASDGPMLVTRSLALARSLDGVALDDALRRAASVMGIPSFIHSVAVPLLWRIGEEWHAGRLGPAQEHLASAVLHDILMESARALPPRPGAPTILVATLAGERHVIGAALVAAASAVRGWRVVYLGADLPATDIADAAAGVGARVVAISVVYVQDRDRVLGELRALRARLAVRATLIVGGSGAASLAADLSAIDVETESTFAGLTAALDRHASAT